jgi:putative NADPH-quinone reductase
MPKLILYYAHPGQQHSQAGRAMWQAAEGVEEITRVDLYADYPRFHIDPDREQDRLRAHDVIVFQFPLYWYSTPALVKEWLDIVLEHGFAYGAGGEALKGKLFGLALTCAGPEEAYQTEGYQHHELRTFLTPLEQTARLCKMVFLPPFVLYGALEAAGSGRIAPHAAAYGRYLTALRAGEIARPAEPREIWTADSLPAPSLAEG